MQTFERNLFTFQMNAWNRLPLCYIPINDELEWIASSQIMHHGWSTQAVHINFNSYYLKFIRIKSEILENSGGGWREMMDYDDGYVVVLKLQIPRIADTGPCRLI